jgi:aldehyde dehydrogenase (NAD+)
VEIRTKPERLGIDARALIARPQVLIGGTWTAGVAAQRITAIDPYAECALAEFPMASLEQADLAVRGARHAFDRGQWGTLSPADRGRLLHRVVEAVDRKRDALAEILVAETGTPMSLKALQVDAMLENLAWFAEAAARGPGGMFEQPLPLHSGAVTSAGLLVREPIGVVAALTPYNVPLLTAAWKVGGALASGSTAILLPAPRAALSSLAWTRLVCEADLPAGSISFLLGDGEVGRRLTESPDVDMVTFTGSNAVGTQVMRQAAGTVKRLVLELGGKSPNLILPGTDIDDVIAPSALRFLRHAGQACGATTRTFVPKQDYERFVVAADAFFATVPVGDPWRPDTVVGPLISSEHRDRVEGYVDRAVAAGGVVEAGGGRPDVPHGYFLNPTLIGRVGNDWEIARDELFGPVGVVIGYDDVADAITMANDSRYGLNANVWGPAGQAIDVARRVRSGTVTVNGGGALRADAPFGGYRQSGIGREAGEQGFAEFFETKHLQWPVG